MPARSHIYAVLATHCEAALDNLRLYPYFFLKIIFVGAHCVCPLSPARLPYSRNFPIERQLPEAQPAQSELAVICPCSAAARTAVIFSRREFRLPFLLDS